MTDTDVEQAVNEAITQFSPVFIDDDSYHELLEHCKPHPFLVTEDGICALVKKSAGKKAETECRIQPISSYVRVKQKLYNCDTSEMFLLLEIDNGTNKVQRRFPRTILSKIEIKALLNYGVKYLENYADMLIRYLLVSENSAETVYVYDSIGWGKLDGTTIFKYDHIISQSGSTDSLKSSYNGRLTLKPHGDLEKWLAMIRSDVIGNVPLTVCTLLAFASPILSYITGKFDLGSLVFSLSNGSSTGKSSTAVLATSVFSNPKLNHGTMRSFNSTANFLMTFLSQTSGLPVALDEGSAFSGDVDKLLYLLATGVERGRLDGNSEMKPEKTWESIILTTSEFDLLNESSNDGLKVRCFVIHDQLTKSAQSADHIKETALTNYGVAGQAYIQWLVDHKTDRIKNDYIKAKSELISEAQSARKTSPFTERILSKLAVVLVAARYVRKCFGLKINIPGIKEYLLNMERQVPLKTDWVKNGLDLILQEISRNSLKFLTPDRLSGQNIVGKVSENKEAKTIAILKTEFQAYCKKNKIQDSHKMLTKLKEEDILQCEADRLTRRVRLNQDLPIQTCYVLRVPDQLAPRPKKVLYDDNLDF